MLYSGDMNDVCAITCTPVKELNRPVGFDTAHAFECEAIVEWITNHRSTNPVTGQNVPKTAVACLLHPLIVDEENAEHIVETQIMLNSSGWVTGSEKAVICSAMSVMRTHVILFSIFAYVFSLSQLKDALGYIIYIIVLSYFQLMHQTYQVYPVNGKWIMCNLCVVGLIVFTMIEPLGLSSTSTMDKFFVSHGAMLVARLLFDTCNACRIDL
jgi:hypothetical protein